MRVVCIVRLFSAAFLTLVYITGGIIWCPLPMLRTPDLKYKD